MVVGDNWDRAGNGAGPRQEAMEMARRLVGAALVSGALVLGTAGAAFGATGATGTPGSAGAGAGAGRCTTLAPRVLERLDKVDSRITTALPKLQAAQQRATSADHTKRAKRIGSQISRLQKRQHKVEARIARIEQRCPGVTPASGPGPAATSSTTA